MSDLVPNLSELVAALPMNSDGVAIASAFEADTVEAARIALRVVVAGWEQHDVSLDASSDDLIMAPAG
jgi:hypothetical protein